MIRVLRTFAWLRWRLLLNGLRGSKRRDALERISRAFAVLAPLLLVLPFGAAAILLAFLGFHAGRNLGTQGKEASLALFVARLILFLVVVLPVLVPLGRATQTTRAGSARLILLPIPRSTIHFAETLASLADPWLGFVVPGLACFAAGLLSAGRSEDALVALAATAGLLAAVASLNALTSFATDWIMRERRRGEHFTLVFVLVLSLVGLLPAVFASKLDKKPRIENAPELAPEASSENAPETVLEPKPKRSRRGFSVEAFDAKLPAWTRALPSELYGSSVQAQIEGRSEKAWLLVGALFAEALALYAASSAVHRRILGTSGSGRARRRSVDVDASSGRWPGLSRGATAVATVTARNALRSVRGRLAVFLPGPLFAFLALLGKKIPDEIPFGRAIAGEGHVLLAFQCLFGLYALQAFHLNQFGSDRAGLSLHFLSPVSDLELVKGKAAGGGVVYLVSLAICCVCAFAVAPGPLDIGWVAVLLSALATYALLAPGAAALSALFPKTADLSKTGSGGNPHGFAILLGTLALSVLVAPPALLLGVGRRWLESDGLVLLLVAGWAALALLLAHPLLALVAPLVRSRRENLALVAGGK